MDPPAGSWGGSVGPGFLMEKLQDPRAQHVYYRNEQGGGWGEEVYAIDYSWQRDGVVVYRYVMRKVYGVQLDQGDRFS